MGQKMTSAPVYYAIAQVRFNQLLALDSYAPTIQESFRKAGFPDVEKSVLATFNLNIGGGDEANQQVPVGRTGRYTFSDLGKCSGFILDQAALSFHSTEYDVFEAFSDRLIAGLAFIHESVGGLSFYDRIGVRYLDAVFPKENEKLSDYLDSGVLGLAGKLQGKLIHSFSETLTQNGMVSVVSRVVVQDGKLAFPPDIQPITFALPERFQKVDGRHAIIDTDGSVAIREKFDLAIVRQRLFEIHDEVDKSFKSAVTERALEVWR